MDRAQGWSAAEPPASQPGAPPSPLHTTPSPNAAAPQLLRLQPPSLHTVSVFWPPQATSLPQRASLLLTSRSDPQAAPSATNSFPFPFLCAAKPSHPQGQAQTSHPAVTRLQPPPRLCLVSPDISRAWYSLMREV